MRPYLDLLRREKDFRRTYLAQLIALGGDWFAIIPLLVLLPTLTGTGIWGAAVLAVDTLVFALVGPYAGTVVDRLDRRRVIVVANTVAGLLQAHAAGLVPSGSRVVCTVTGNGLKDPDWAISGAPKPVPVANSAEAAAAALGLA